MSSNTQKTVLALLTGAAIGASLGILFAPDKGSKTREKIKDGFDDAKHNLKNKISKTSEDLRERFLKKKLNTEESFEDLVSTMSHRTEDVISFLESKLADLKEQNHKLQK